jgi:hypothetical protein
MVTRSSQSPKMAWESKLRTGNAMKQQGDQQARATVKIVRPFAAETALAKVKAAERAKKTTDPEIMRHSTVNLIAAGACLVCGIAFTVTGRPVTATATLAVLGLVNLAITLAR